MIVRTLKHTFSLLNTDHVKLGTKWNYKNVISPYHRIYYIDAGRGTISDMEKSIKLEPGYLYIIPSFTLCNLSCDEFLGQYFVQFFEESSDGISLFINHRSIFKIKVKDTDIMNFNRLLEINPGRGINRSDNPKIYEKNSYYDEYQALNNQQNMATFIETQGILLQMVSRFLTPDILKDKTARNTPGKIHETLGFVLTNLNLPLTVKLLAERANQNPEYFSRLFEKYVGVRPSNYIVQKRIERAQYLMATNEMKFSEVARMTGFESLSHFSRTFKKTTGLSPRNFKAFANSGTH